MLMSSVFRLAANFRSKVTIIDPLLVLPAAAMMFYYTNKIRGREKEKGIQIKMRVKLAAKLLVIAWTLMKKKENFNPAYLNAE